jgi:hypothetical protein
VNGRAVSLQGPLGLRDGHLKTALRRPVCSAPDDGVVNAIERVKDESHESRCGILSNLAIHVWVWV